MADAEPTDRSLAGQALAAVGQFREVAKWLITAFAAVGALVVAGLQLTSLGQTSGWRLVAALLGVAAAIGGAMFAVVTLTSLMQPIVAAPDDAVEQAGKPGTDLNAFMAQHGTLLLPDGVKDAQELFDKYDAARKSEQKEEREPIPRLRTALLDLVAWYAYFSARKSFLYARNKVIGAAVIVAVGAALFAWAATPAEDDTAAAAVPASPVLVNLHLNSTGANDLASVLPADCITAATSAAGVPAIALMADTTQTTVVLVPAPGTCPSPIRLTIPLNQGLVSPAASVSPAVPATSSPTK